MRLIPTTMIVLVALISTATFVAPAISQKRDSVSVFMRAKLLHSQRVVEGLTTENYTMIAKGAQEMSLLSQASQWQVIQTPEYVQRSSEFRRATDKLRKEAQEKDLDGALLSYVDVTMKCVECHKYVRSVQTAKLDNLDILNLKK